MTDQWQELKDTITEMRDNDGTGTQQEVCKFLVNYMDILEKQMQEPCEDAIGREDMLDAIGHGTTYTSEELQRIIKGLPPVTPQQKIGHWIFVDKAHEHARCSECDYGNVDLLDGRPHNYCPNCGCRMIEPQERSEKE